MGNIGRMVAWTIEQPGASPAEPDGFIDALTGGGDSRLVIDRLSGVNKYLCPPVPAPDLVCVSSCTASPIAPAAFWHCAETFVRLNSAASPGDEWAGLHRQIETRLLACFGATGLAHAILCPSGTDALLTAALLLAGEQPGSAVTAILPQASETGSGVPLAASLRQFDGPAASSLPPIDCAARVIEIALRYSDGTPIDDNRVAEAFKAAASAATDRPIVFLTHGTKTGLIAPTIPPAGSDVIVDACQGRIAPETVARYLRRGWPVVVTGSKFFGGPAFSGAVLFPTARGAARTPVPANPGMLLRWLSALDTMEAFAAIGGQCAGLIQAQRQAIEAGIAATPNAVPMPGLSTQGSGWSDSPTIFSFALRSRSGHLLTAAELRPIYTRLARSGVLLGQPVEFGRFGALRIAIGARDTLPAATANQRLPDVFAALREEAVF